MSGDPRRGATIRRSLTPDTALGSVLRSTSDSASAVGVAGAWAAGVGAGARTGSAARCSSITPSSDTRVSVVGSRLAGLPAERRGGTIQATVWESRTRTVDLPLGISLPPWLPGARWQDREAGTGLDPGLRQRTETDR